jgi:iron uptake system EfeUOB component EfeO/EfeM
MHLLSLPRFARFLGVSLLALGVAATAAAGPYDDGVRRYRTVLIADIGDALAGARKLHERVVAGDVAGAKTAWLAARAGWERSEVFTSGFVPELDRDIDAWPDASKGFHAIEAKLFGANRTDMAEETRTLVDNLDALSTSLRDMALSAQGLLNGIVRLVYEVGESKVDGGESRISGTSLEDMRANVEGVDVAWRTIFASPLAAHDAARDADIQRRIGTLRTIVAAPALRRIDPDHLRRASEELVLALQEAAPALGLKTPSLEESN